MKHLALSIDPKEFKIKNESVSSNHDEVGLRTVTKILTFWGFDESERLVVLDGASPSDIDNENSYTGLTTDQRTRISLLLGIYRALKTNFIQDLHHIQWINNQNKAFADLSPKSIMLCGALINLYDIRNYLATQS